MDWQKIYNEAINAGMEAGNGHQPVPMIVQQHSNMLDDNSAVVQSWNVPSGVCGFAWVVIKPATSQFARWLKSKGIVDSVAYGGGYHLWCSEFGQSMEKKEAWARAVSKVLNSYGVKAFAQSRMD